MQKPQTFDNARLNSAGLNRQAIFNIEDLPVEIVTSLLASGASVQSYRQLILIGHAGRMLWQSLKASGIVSENPIDDFTVQTMQHWFAECHAQNTCEIIYPGECAISLQRLGQLAGWHHATPFMVGIDREWGSWYAYRAVLLADTAFEPTKPVVSASPCKTCGDRVCIVNCPGAALEGGHFDIGKCVSYRKQTGSSCKTTCLARISCPVGSIHRYSDEQIQHSYSVSMRAIERYF